MARAIFAYSLMTTSLRKRAIAAFTVVGVCVAFSGCARWRPEPLEPGYTTFDEFLPSNIRSVVYLPDLPETCDRFNETELARRIGEQKRRELWRKIDLLRPWVAAVHGQIIDQVDEFAWGAYRAEGREAWFFVARINQPGRHVLKRLQEKTLPRIAEDLPGIEFAQRRVRGRRLYEWRLDDGVASRRIISYCVIGRFLVMGSDDAYVQNAVASRPAWWRRGSARPDRGDFASRDELRTVFANYKRGSDVHAWFRVAGEPFATAEDRSSHLRRLGDRLRGIVTSRLSAVNIDLHITPPMITGRWGLAFGRSLQVQSVEEGRIDFAEIAPASAQTLIAIHRLPLDHPLFDDLRLLLSEVISNEALGPVRGAIAILKLLPGIREVPEVIRSLDRQVSYCSFTDEGDRKRRCLMIALENADIVESALRAVPGFLGRLVEKSEYRGRPFLRVPIPGAGATGGTFLTSVDGTLVLATHLDTVHELVDGIENRKTMSSLPMVRQARKMGEGVAFAEFFSAGTHPARSTPSASDAEMGAVQRTTAFVRKFLKDSRVIELAEGQSYSICLEQPNGIEVVTSSATGFHWSGPTAGLAAVVFRMPSIRRLLGFDAASTPSSVF